MGWVNETLTAVRQGRSIQIRPSGGSMRGRIESRQRVTLAPFDPAVPAVDAIVLVRWKGNYLPHLVKEIQGSQILIANTIGKVNGWVDVADICAIVTNVDDGSDVPDSHLPSGQ